MLLFHLVSVVALACETEFSKLADYNPTAKQSFYQYKNPNARSLREYDEVFRPKNGSLQHELEEGEIAIDVGGGWGEAYRELAQQKRVMAVVINTQENLEAEFVHTTPGVWKYEQGWAEEKLKLYTGKAKLITDLWGAFSYSSEKKQLIEEMWNALKPGGIAYIYFDPVKAPAQVKTKEGIVSFEDWLTSRFPSIVQVKRSGGFNLRFGKIITLKKPVGEAPTFLLNLTVSKKEKGDLHGRPTPALMYEEP